MREGERERERETSKKTDRQTEKEKENSILLRKMICKVAHFWKT